MGCEIDCCRGCLAVRLLFDDGAGLVVSIGYGPVYNGGWPDDCGEYVPDAIGGVIAASTLACDCERECDWDEYPPPPV